MLGELAHQIAQFAPKAGVALLVFIFFWVVSLLVEKMARQIGRRSHLSAELLTLIGRTTSLSLVVLGAITALGTAGINVSALVAGLGLTGFALGFALKDALANLLAGLLILIYRPFKRHDRISVAGFEGVVVETDLRYTTLQDETKTILIPNSTLFTNSIVLLDQKNGTYRPESSP
ncbi:MAG: mechanosensitive ion channel [Nitrospirae bacterium]|nr:mechanosensitive ion channel [Candidatus Manganitrophaceae bacterium]